MPRLFWEGIGDQKGYLLFGSFGLTILVFGSIRCSVFWTNYRLSIVNEVFGVDGEVGTDELSMFVYRARSLLFLERDSL